MSTFAQEQIRPPAGARARRGPRRWPAASTPVSSLGHRRERRDGQLRNGQEASCAPRPPRPGSATARDPLPGSRRATCCSRSPSAASMARSKRGEVRSTSATRPKMPCARASLPPAASPPGRRGRSPRSARWISSSEWRRLRLSASSSRSEMTCTSLSANAARVRRQRLLLGAAPLGELERELPALLRPARSTSLRSRSSADSCPRTDCSSAAASRCRSRSSSRRAAEGGELRLLVGDAAPRGRAERSALLLQPLLAPRAGAPARRPAPPGRGAWRPRLPADAPVSAASSASSAARRVSSAESRPASASPSERRRRLGRPGRREVRPPVREGLLGLAGLGVEGVHLVRQRLERLVRRSPGAARRALRSRPRARAPGGARACSVSPRAAMRVLEAPSARRGVPGTGARPGGARSRGCAP